jgi:DNA-directed RNA polymerase specialized sigma24 family protein
MFAQSLVVSPPSPQIRAAHAALYRAHAARLRSLARSILDTSADAEDVVQETFTNAWMLAVQRPGLLPPPVSWLGAEARRIATEMKHRRSMERPLKHRSW